MAELVKVAAADRLAILALNNAHARETSWLEAADLDRLLEQTYLALRVGADDAFLLCFDQSADGYRSPNYLWFRERYPRFAYVDRIIVAEHARGRGLARQLYEELFATAKADGHTIVACEVNSDPPNPGSDAFHAAMGFAQVGSATIYGGKRTVTYLVRNL
jgi:predicted GNAT superfamily acetyltransferase